MTDKPKYIFDTNVFDFILDNNIDISAIKELGTLYTTNVQFSELSKIPDEDRRNKLLEIYDRLESIKITLKSGIWIDDLRWDDEQPWVDAISEECENLTGNSINKPWKDALIGEVAKLEGVILVTNDSGFISKARTNNISVIETDILLKHLCEH